MIDFLAAVLPVITFFLLICVGVAHAVIAHVTSYYRPFMAWYISYLLFIIAAVPTYFYGYVDEAGIGRVVIFAIRVVAQLLQLWAAVTFLKIYCRERNISLYYFSKNED